MALNDLLTTAQPTAADPPISDPNPPVVENDDAPDYGEAEEQEDGSRVYADGYRIDAEGRHFGPDGVEIPETVEDEGGGAPAPVAVAPAPAPVAPVVPAPVAPVVPQTPQAPHIYTYANCFTQAEAEEIQQLDMSEPMKAQQRRFETWKKVDAYAQDRFNEQLDALEATSPEVFAKYGRRIERAATQLTVEQKQAPGIVGHIAAQIALREIAADPKRLEDLVLGRTTAPAVAAVPAPVVKPPAPVLPPAQRMPSPRTAGGQRRQVPNRNGGGGNMSSLKTIQQLYPGMSDEDAKEYMQGIQNAEKRRDA